MFTYYKYGDIINIIRDIIQDVQEKGPFVVYFDYHRVLFSGTSCIIPLMLLMLGTFTYHKDQPLSLQHRSYNLTGYCTLLSVLNDQLWCQLWCHTFTGCDTPSTFAPNSNVKSSKAMQSHPHTLF